MKYDFSHWGELPFVSCQCITYGRTHLLDEAVESFLRQDYKGKKELIILNDYPDMEIEFNHPEVKVINLPIRMKSVGEKRNACVALCKGSVIFVWDDDDISLPNRISYSIANMKDYSYFKADESWLWQKGEIVKEQGPASLLHPMSAWSVEWFDAVGGYSHIQLAEDVEIEEKFNAKGKKIHPTPLNERYYIYRWNGTNSYHLSHWAHWGIEKAYNGTEDYVKEKKLSGKHIINPHWSQDYIKMVEETIEYIEAQK